MRTAHIFVLLLFTVHATMPAYATAYAYGPGTTTSDARYGATVGAGVQWSRAFTPAGDASANAGFGGNVTLSCSGIDFQGFLQRFNPSELLNQMKNTLMSGAQAAVSSYLITLAYANPTIASVLDMMDKKFTARFDAFAQACNAQEARKRGEDEGASRMADASDQCFADQIGKGTSPTEAYRVCANARTFGDMDLPALKQTSDFLKKYTSLNVTKEISAMLNLLPDEKVTSGGLQMKPPTATTMQVYENVEGRAKNAIKAVLSGTDPATIPLCNEQDILKAPSGDAMCIPSTASNLVNSPTFLSARLLSPAAAELYSSAMSSQIATTALYSNIYELKQQVALINAKDSTGVSAEEVLRRRESLMKSIDRLEQEADALRKIQESKAKLAKTQILTMQKVEQELASTSSRANGDVKTEGTGVGRFIRMFF